LEIGWKKGGRWLEAGRKVAEIGGKVDNPRSTGLANEGVWKHVLACVEERWNVLERETPWVTGTASEDGWKHVLACVEDCWKVLGR
jgi:hypothetical protein